MDDALQAGGPAGDDGQDADHQRDREEHHLGRPQPEDQRPGSQIEARAMTGMVSPMLAIADP